MASGVSGFESDFALLWDICILYLLCYNNAAVKTIRYRTGILKAYDLFLSANEDANHDQHVYDLSSGAKRLEELAL
jgi:hypothetical protein